MYYDDECPASKNYDVKINDYYAKCNKQTYKELAPILHPDKNGISTICETIATKKMQQLNAIRDNCKSRVKQKYLKYKAKYLKLKNHVQ